ncbi:MULTISPECIES: hypothetical protein [unclassified Streptomyces]|uniref:VWA domain-containing protein n=1 Tax=Streptomyces sp. NBC_00060 TaxID=2975636 RepID=A0AAU2GVD0_9ACTN
MPGSELPGTDVLPPGPLRTLTVELHGLHRKAGLPSARLVEAWVKADRGCAATVSHTTFRTMLHGTTLVSWIKWASVVRVLAANAVTLPDRDTQIERFHALWLDATSAPAGSPAPPVGPQIGAPPVGPQNGPTAARAVSHPLLPVQELSYPQMARQLCMPVYIAVDAPSPPGIRDRQFDNVLGVLHDQLASAPRIAELAHVCVVAFSAQPYVVVELTDVSDLIRMPKVVCIGEADYAASFTLLRERMEADVAALGDQGWAVRRPLVLLLSNGTPKDDSWRAALRRLVDHRHRSRPHIIGYGFSPAAMSFVTQVATLAAFQADLNGSGTVPGGELVAAVGRMLNSMVASAHTRPLTLPEAPAEYRSIPVEYLD